MPKHQPSRHETAADDDPVNVAEIGESIYQQLARDLENTSLDQFVVINIPTRSHVIARSRKEVMQQYTQRFGDSPGYLRKIGSLDNAGNVRL